MIICIVGVLLIRGRTLLFSFHDLASVVSTADDLVDLTRKYYVLVVRYTYIMLLLLLLLRNRWTFLYYCVKYEMYVRDVLNLNQTRGAVRSDKN